MTNPLHNRIEALRGDDPYNLLGSSLVSEKHRYVWVQNARTGSRSTMMALRALEGNPYRGGNVWHEEGIRYLSDFDTDRVVEMLSAEEWYRFAFVRNPYDRLFSAYKSKIGNVDAESFYQDAQNEIRALNDYPTVAGHKAGAVCFRDFVDFVVDGGRAHDGHWCVLAKRMLCDVIPYDFIGRFETFRHDFAAVLRRLDAPPQILASTARVYNRSAEIWLAAAYDRETAAAVYGHYRQDFESFGYDRDSWLFS